MKNDILTKKTQQFRKTKYDNLDLLIHLYSNDIIFFLTCYFEWKQLMKWIIYNRIESIASCNLHGHNVSLSILSNLFYYRNFNVIKIYILAR